MMRAIGIGVLFLLCCPLATFGQDTCATAIPVGEGATPFSTVGLVTDGPIPACGFGFNTDIFFVYTPTCSGSVTVDTCATLAGELDDTILAIYDGAGCAPVGPVIGCSDDFCGPGSGYNSSLTFAATAGSSYLIQVGGWNGEAPGASTLTIVNAGAPCGPPPPVTLNEIRIDNPGTDVEFAELVGAPGLSLAPYTYLVLGDGTTASGVIETVIPLTAVTDVIPADGHFLLGLAAVVPTPDKVVGPGTALGLLNFENDDNVTHMIVEGFTGAPNTDLDTNDDGVLDLTPWTAIIDSVSIVVNTQGFNSAINLDCNTLGTFSEKYYSANTVGPDLFSTTLFPTNVGNEDVPGYVQVCGGGWVVGNATRSALHTPGSPNVCATPLNDLCAFDGTTYTGLPLFTDSPVAFSNVGAANDGPTPSCQANSGADVWFQFTTPAGTTCAGDVTYSLAGSSFDTIITVYTGTACASFIEIACNDDFIGLASEVTIPAVAAGTVHRVRVSGFGGATGDGIITVSHSATPVNDECSNAIAILDGLTPFSNLCATNSGLNVPPPASNTIQRDLWYSYTAICTGTLTVSTDIAPIGTLTDTKLAIYPDVSCPLSCLDLLGFDDDGGVTCGFCSVMNVQVIAGETYLLRVGSFSSVTTGTGTISITCTPVCPPSAVPNDFCCSQIPVGEGVFSFDTTGAGTEASAVNPPCDPGPFGDDQIHSDVYYCYTPACAGTVTILATGYDTRLAVYDSCFCPGGAAPPATGVITCDDDTGSGGVSPYNAQVTFAAAAGTSYMVRVGGFSAFDVGPGILTITNSAVPANNECAGAMPITDGVTLASSVCSSPSADPIAGCTFTAANRDVWFSYLASCNGIVSVDLSGSGPLPSLNWDTVCVVYDGCGGPQVGCDDDAGAGLTSLVSFNAIAGTDYRIRVGAFGATVTGDISLTLSCTPPVPGEVCIDAQAIGGSGTFIVDLGPPAAVTDGIDLTGVCEVGAPTAGSGDGFPFGDNLVHHDVWLCYTPCVPVGQTATVSLTTLGAGFDTRLAVYTDCLCPALAADLIACDDDTATAGAAPFEAAIPTVTMAGGTSYLIQVGTFGEADPTNLDVPLQITCTPDCVPPTAVFDATPTSGNAPATVIFTDSSTGTGPLTYSWDFDGDAVEDDNTQNPSFVYTTPGTYAATLTVSNFCGSSSASTSIQVCQPLVPAFTVTNSGLAEACASFTDSTTGDIAGWDWDFGNGDTSTAQNPSTTYPGAGSYTVTLTVTGSCGRIESTSQTLTVLAAGDCNADESINVADPLFLAAYLFSGGGTSSCMSACEVNGDAALNLGDVVYELYYLFSGGSAPVPPAPCTACN